MRVSFIPEDISDSSVVINKDRLYLVDRYKYGVNRSLDEYGMPYGDTVLSELELIIRVSDLETYKCLYRHIEKEVQTAYSIIFDINNKQGTKAYDGISFRGYVVHINELFYSEDDGQMLLVLTFLLNGITYVGKGVTKPLFITR